MTLLAEAIAETPIGVGLADTLADLSVLTEEGCAAALWNRQMPKAVQDWLADLDPDHLPCGRVIQPVDEIGPAFDAFCDAAGTPKGPNLDWLRADIVEMAAVFANLMAVDVLRLRLDAVTTNACRKFHVDALTARLVCTYRGAGTQYGIAHDGANPAEIFDVATGAPILLRGTLWPEEPPSGLRHRSPPIEGTGETRLLLVLDPIFDPEDEM